MLPVSLGVQIISIALLQSKIKSQNQQKKTGNVLASISPEMSISSSKFNFEFLDDARLISIIYIYQKYI